MTAAEVANLAVRISLEDKLTGGIAKMTRTLGKFDANAGRTGKGVKQLTGGLLKVGVIAGAAVATGLGLAARTAIGFDDAFAAVAKTVEASKPDLQALNDQLHALATRIPVDYTDLAGIAAEAGALGVPTKSVAKFTEVVARLSAATQGLTPEAAAEAFGKFRNTLKITDSQLTNTASALIALGNAGASSEADIIEVGKRFAAAGHLAGLSAADVLGFSSAITSLGVEPEAAGSSLSRLFNNITKYIGTGDKKIVAFAKTAGVSVKTFSHLFAHDAKGAVLDFLQGLSKLDKFQATRHSRRPGSPTSATSTRCCCSRRTTRSSRASSACPRTRSRRTRR
jgi:TP901 family phage tail tape measure protein